MRREWRTRKEPPGAKLRYHVRLTTPSTCPHIVRAFRSQIQSSSNFLLNLFLSLSEFRRFNPERIGDPHPFEEAGVSSTLFDVRSK